jgi:hypothetical protein
VIESRPGPGAGTECLASDPACGVALRTDVVLHFDRPLWPRADSFEALRVYSGSPSNRVPVSSIRYDLLDWTLTYRLLRPLRSRALYQVELPGANGSPGPRAFDGAPLEAGALPLAFSFLTRSDTSGEPPPDDVPAPTCDEVVRVLETHCASGCCHGGDRPAMGLRLDSREGLLTTALRHVAHQTETAGTAGLPHSNPARFGTAMPLLDPGSAATSYLVYKLLIAPTGFEACTEPSCQPFTVLPGAASCAPWPDAERARLRDWFVRGEAMPLDPGSLGCAEATPPRALDCASLRALIAFVDAGADCD